MCSKRVFSRNNLDINYKDYNTIKSGNEILKAVKYNDNNAILNKFTSYNSLQALSASYFKYLDNNTTEISYVKNLYETNESFIDTNCIPLITANSCLSEKNILYPYGNIIPKKEISPVFPSNIYLCKWCNKTKINKPKIDLCSKKDSTKITICEKIPTCDCDCKGKKYKPLFI